MPGGLDLLVYRDFETYGDEMVTEVENRLESSSGDATSITAAEGTRTTKTHLYWQLWPGDSDVFALKCAGLVPDHNQDYESICLTFCATCTYPTSLDVRSMLEDGKEFDALYGALPTAVINPSICVYRCPSNGLSRFRYLKFISATMLRSSPDFGPGSKRRICWWRRVQGRT